MFVDDTLQIEYNNDIKSILHKRPLAERLRVLCVYACVRACVRACIRVRVSSVYGLEFSTEHMKTGVLTCLL